jgi:hypothetical protein
MNTSRIGRSIAGFVGKLDIKPDMASSRCFYEAGQNGSIEAAIVTRLATPDIDA